MEVEFLCFGKIGTDIKQVISRSNKNFEFYCQSLSAILWIIVGENCRQDEEKDAFKVMTSLPTLLLFNTSFPLGRTFSFPLRVTLQDD